MPKTLLIGSEGGLGRALSDLWSQQGFDVYGVDRLTSSHLEPSRFFHYDLKQSTNQLFEQLSDLSFQQVLFVAAGGYYGDFEDQSNIEELIKINFKAPMALARGLAHQMEPRGQMIFIGSVSTMMPTPDYAIYSACKKGLESFVRSWRLEVQDQFQVKIFHPGAMKTKFHQEVGFIPSEKQQLKFSDPALVAQKIWRWSQSNAWVGGYKGLRLLNRLMPSLIDRIFLMNRGQQ